MNWTLKYIHEQWLVCLNLLWNTHPTKHTRATHISKYKLHWGWWSWNEAKVIFVNKPEIDQKNFISEIYQKITSVPHFSLVWEILLALCWQTACNTQQIRINYFDSCQENMIQCWKNVPFPDSLMQKWLATKPLWDLGISQPISVSMSSEEICISSREGTLLYTNR